MSEGNDKHEIRIQGLASILSQYGSIGFGIASLVLIWTMIVEPQLEDAKLDFEKQQQIVDSLRDMTASQSKTSESLKQTAQILERLLNRMESSN